MILTLVVSFGLVIYRMPLLRARNELDSWASREAAFLVNNWVLLFAAFFTLFATMFPTLSEAVTGERLTVGAPFFNQWLTPVGLLLLFLTGVGPLLAWRKSTVSNLIQQFVWPGLSAAVALGMCFAFGIPFWAPGLCFTLCAFVAGSMAQEFIRGASVRRRATGTDLFTALVGLFARSKRRYGGYVVHLGIVLVFLGFAGGAFERDETVLLTPGQTFELSPYAVRYVALSVTQDATKQMVTADVEVSRDGKVVARMYPARWFWAGREGEPTTEVALRRGPAEDLYLVLAGYDAGEQSTTAFAQHVENASAVRVMPRSDLEKDLQEHLVCMCGTCGRQRIGECTCSTAAGMRDELSKLVAQGMGRDDIIQYYVGKYGSQEVLGAPLNTGFNRLAWALPYAAGLFGIAIVGAVAVRWSRRREEGQPGDETAAPRRQDLEDRLDDELRELD
jgi:cytochrome c-type biogenesis protein CcmH/NrfF